MMRGKITQDEAFEIATGFIRSNIGDIPGVTSIDRGRKRWHVTIGADIVRMIKDDSTGEKKMRFLRFSELGKIVISNRGRIMEKPHRALISRNVISEMKTTRLIVDDILRQVAVSNFTELVSAKHMFSPIERILGMVLERGKITSDILTDRKYKNYLELLQKIGLLIPQTNDLTIPSNEFIVIQEKYRNDTEKVKRLLMEIVFARAYPELKNTFNVTKPIEPYIHLSGAYYSMALEYSNKITCSRPSLKSYYEEVNRPIDDLRFVEYLSTLVNLNILQRTDDKITANEEIYRKMINHPQINDFLPINKSP